MADGLGPTYNAQSCRECHQNVVTGGASQVTEHRTGRLQNGQFFESLGGSLIQSRATHPDMAERVNFQDDIRTFRVSTNTLGAGFVEAISNDTLLAIRNAQPAGLRGTALTVPVLEAGGKKNRQVWMEEPACQPRIVFWRCVPERMGITTPMFPARESSGGMMSLVRPRPRPPKTMESMSGVCHLHACDQSPARDPSTRPSPRRGSVQAVGCTTCHVATIRTAPETSDQRWGAVGAPRTRRQLIHPYSDFSFTMWGQATGFLFCPMRNRRRLPRRFGRPLVGPQDAYRLMHDGSRSPRKTPFNAMAGRRRE